MAHPFTKIFDLAIKKSTDFDNQVLIEAEKIINKGYQPEEVYEVLNKLQKSLIDSRESSIVLEAMAEIELLLK